MLQIDTCGRHFAKLTQLAIDCCKTAEGFQQIGLEREEGLQMATSCNLELHCYDSIPFFLPLLLPFLALLLRVLANMIDSNWLLCLHKGKRIEDPIL